MNKIGIVKQDNNRVKVYNDRGTFLFARPGAINGYTQESFSVKNNNGTVKQYDAKGNYKFSR